MIKNDLNLWNNKQIDPPPFVTLSYTNTEFNDLFKTNTFSVLFKNYLEKLKNLFESGDYFFLSEKQMLEKLIFKNWNSLRKEKSLQYMKKLKHFLNDFVNFKFNNLVETINIMTGSLDRTNEKKSKISLPSREVFEYFLIRLYAILTLFNHIMFTIRNKICFFIIKYIKNGIFLSNNILYLCNVSRIYCIIKKYQINSKFLYNNLREHIHLFKSTSLKWNESFSLDMLPINVKDTKLNLDDHNLEQSLENFEKNINFSTKNEDIGELIDRDSIEKISKPKDKKKKLNSSKRKILFKKIQLLISSTDQIDKIKSKFKRFIKGKIKKNSLNYSSFLRDCLADKKSFIKKLNGLLQNVSNLNQNEKSLFSKSIIKIIKKLIK